MSSARFQIRKSANGKFMFHLRAANGEVVLASELHTSRESAEEAIASVKRNATIPQRYDMRCDRNGQPYFVLRGSSGEVIGMSEMYATVLAMEGGVDVVIREAPGAAVE